MKKANIEEFFHRLEARDPDPRGELDYINPYTLLVAVVLSAQATDVGVNKATGPLFKVADTPQKMLALGEARVRDYIKTIGLFNTKAKNVIALSRLLIDRHGAAVPDGREALEKLPGVGRKTANVLLGNWYGQPAIMVDTHVTRLSGRLGLTTERDAVKIEFALRELLPKKDWTFASHALIWHGRRVCKARKPACEDCTLASDCPFPAQR